jgi:hypothetical protein
VELAGSHRRDARYADLLLELANSSLASGAVDQAAHALAAAQSVRLRSPAEVDESIDELFWLSATSCSIKLAIQRDGGVGAAFPSEARDDSDAKEVYARLSIEAALSLYRNDAARIEVLSRCRREMAELFEQTGVSEQTRAGLEDMDMLFELGTTRGQKEEAVDWGALLGQEHAKLVARANAGDAAALTKIGALFGRGEGVERNPIHAAWWYQRAIDAGSATAALNLAQMYRHGEGVPQNITRGVELTRLAAERGMTVAKCNLGVMLLSGEDCVTDFVGARQWLQAAHDEGDDLASLALAPLLAQGLGGPRDLERARSYLRRLANRGNVAAIRLLASIET